MEQNNEGISVNFKVSDCTVDETNIALFYTLRYIAIL